MMGMNAHRDSVGNTSLAGSMSSAGITAGNQSKSQRSKRGKSQKHEKPHKSVWNVDSVAVEEADLTIKYVIIKQLMT